MTKNIFFDNQKIAEILTDIATAYTIKNENRFKIDAYKEAAENIITNPTPLFLTWKDNPKLLDDIPGIGQSILKKLDYIFKHQKIPASITNAKSGIPKATFYFTKINGIGPKIAYKLAINFKFPQNEQQAIKKLIKYGLNHKIKKLDDMGEKSELAIVKNCQDYLHIPSRIPLLTAQKIAEDIINYFHQKFPQIEIFTLGSLRRQLPTVKDIDLAVKSNNTSSILNYFVKYPKIKKIINKGNKKASIKLIDQTRVDIMIQPEKTFGSLLQHFTGSKIHNIKLRQYALSKGFSLSEYGVKDNKTGKIFTFSDEMSFYNFLGLNFIPPIKRIGDKEIDDYKIKK